MRGLFFYGKSSAIDFLLLAILCAVPYVPGLPGPFLLDDWGNLEPMLGVELGLASIYDAMFSNASGLLMRPVSNLTLVANLLATGPTPLPFKLSNLVIHAAATGVACFVAGRILRAIRPDLSPGLIRLAALLAAALWATHPIQVSTVLYVVQRMAMLSALFCMLAVAMAVRPLATANPARHGVRNSILLFFVFTSLAVLSKENGALTPLLLAAVWVVAPRHGSGSNRGLGVLAATAVVMPLIIGCVVVVANWDALVGGFSGRPFSLAERLLTQPAVLFTYLGAIAWPDPDRMALFLDDVRAKQLGDMWSWIPVGAMIAISAVSLVLRRRFPVAAFAWLWFLACHAMESTFLPLELAFEHRNYLALLGPALLVGTAVVDLSTRLRPASTALWVPGALALALVAAAVSLTLERAGRWSSIETFAYHEVRNRPDSLRAQNLAAIVDRRRGDVSSAIARMEPMRALYPDAFFPHAMDMDFACDDPMHRVDWEAIRRTAATSMGTSEVLGYFNHIVIRINRGHCAGVDAILMHQQLEALIADALKANGRHAAQYFLVLRATLDQRTRPDQARKFIRSAIELDRHSTQMWERAALFELATGNVVEAESALDALDRLLPRFSPRRYRLERLRAAIRDAAGPPRA